MATEEIPNDGGNPGILHYLYVALSDIYIARFVTAVMLAIVVLETIVALFVTQIMRGDKDPTISEARNQFFFELVIPAAVFIAATVRVTGKKKSKVNYNAFALVCVLLLAVASLVIFVWVFAFCFVISDTVTVPIDDTHNQIQPIAYPVGKGIGLICQYFAGYVTFLLGLDVWAATK
jgi:hypothetical protein